jgi:hypothetical protein
MTNGLRNGSSTIRRIRRWLAGPEGFAAAAAGSGEPTPLLTLERC